MKLTLALTLLFLSLICAFPQPDQPKACPDQYTGPYQVQGEDCRQYAWINGIPCYNPKSVSCAPNLNLYKPASALTSSADSTSNNTVDDIGNSLTSPLQSLKGITVTGILLGVILISTGFLLVFFGHRLFKPVLFIAGFYVFAVLSFVILSAIEQRNGSLLFGDNRAIVFLIVAIVSGFIGGFLFICVWRLGLSAIGALLGFTIAIVVLSFVSGGVIASGTGRTIFIICFAVVGAILIQFIEKPVLILGTAIPGSYALFFGIDVFTKTGFNNATQMFLNGNGFYTTSPAVYGMLAGVLVLAIIGILVQFHNSKTHRGGSRRGGAYEKA